MGPKFIEAVEVTRWPPFPYRVKTFKIVFFGTEWPISLKLRIKHWTLKYYMHQGVSNDDPRLTFLTLLYKGQLWFLILLYGQMLKWWITQTHWTMYMCTRGEGPFFISVQGHSDFIHFKQILPLSHWTNWISGERYRTIGPLVYICLAKINSFHIVVYVWSNS